MYMGEFGQLKRKKKEKKRKKCDKHTELFHEC